MLMLSEGDALGWVFRLEEGAGGRRLFAFGFDSIPDFVFFFSMDGNEDLGTYNHRCEKSESAVSASVRRALSTMVTRTRTEHTAHMGHGKYRKLQV